jgi:hypothetical protein
MGFARLTSEYYARWPNPFASQGDDPEGLDDESIDFIRERMDCLGHDKALFFSGFFPEPGEEWRAFVKSRDKLFFCIFRSDGLPVVLYWFELVLQTGRQAFAHFCGIAPSDEYDIIVCGEGIHRLLSERTGLRQLIGITPACYGHALKVAYAIGYDKLAKLRKAVLVHGKERDAVITLKDIGGCV